MAAKGASCFGAILSTLFTALVAPIVVSIVTAEVKPSETKASGQPGAGEGAVRALPAPSTEVMQVIAQGVGWTPDEAAQDALRNALKSAAATHFDADTWARQGQALFEAVLRDTRGLIARYQGLRSGRGCHQGREFYQTTLAVEVAQRPLTDRLRGAALTTP